MIAQAFQHRSGRVIALSRAVLAVSFTIAVLLEPAEQYSFRPGTAAVLMALTLISAIILGLTWRNWWLDARLAAPAHVFDIAIFTVLVSMTGGYLSPFFGVYFFLVLAASVRWGWRAAAVTTGVVIVLFFVASVAAASATGIQLQRFMLRATNLSVMSIMLIWFSVNQFGFAGRRFASRLGEPSDAIEPPVDQALDHVARGLKAGRALFVWSDEEEPWLRVASLKDGKLSHQRLGPEDYPAILAEGSPTAPFLFDVARRRMLTRGPNAPILRRADTIDRGFAERFYLAEGLAIPIRAEGIEGTIFALDVPGLCVDDLAIAQRLGDDVSAAVSRVAMLRAMHEAGETRTRLFLARDLHDSVVQFQAGMALRLQAIRLAAAEGQPIDEDLVELQRQIGQEQRDLRGMIAGLREQPLPTRSVDLGQRMAALCNRLQGQWDVSCSCIAEPAGIEVTPELQHDIDQLIREAVANAVRHGHARNVAIRASLADRLLRLNVDDDGSGFPEHGHFADSELRERGIGPRSLQERVSNLGGRLMLETSGRGSRLAIALPHDGADQ